MKFFVNSALPICHFLLHYLLFRLFQISRISRHRQVPKHIKNAQNELKTIRASKSRKEANRRKHSKPGSVPYVPEREKNVVDEK